MPGMTEKRILTKQEYAEYWKVSASTVDAWIAQGKIKPQRTPGGAPRFIHPEDAEYSPAVATNANAE